MDAVIQTEGGSSLCSKSALGAHAAFVVVKSLDLPIDRCLGAVSRPFSLFHFSRRDWSIASTPSRLFGSEPCSHSYLY